MKFLLKITLVLSIILLCSCSKNDDSSDDIDMSNTEFVIGDWQLDKRFYIQEDGTLIEVDLESCDMFRSITFNDDFTYVSIRRSEDNCETISEEIGDYEFIEENRIIFNGSPFAIYNIEDDLIKAEYVESFFTEQFIKQ